MLCSHKKSITKNVIKILHWHILINIWHLTGIYKSKNRFFSILIDHPIQLSTHYCGPTHRRRHEINPWAGVFALTSYSSGFLICSKCWSSLNWSVSNDSAVGVSTWRCDQGQESQCLEIVRGSWPFRRNFICAFASLWRWAWLSGDHLRYIWRTLSALLPWRL